LLPIMQRAEQARISNTHVFVYTTKALTRFLLYP